MAQTEVKTDRILTITLHGVFFLSGIATVLIGQVLPLISARFSLNDLQSGYMFPAQFAGSLTGTMLTYRLGKQGRLALASGIGAALMAAGILLLDTGSFGAVLAGFVINGLGIGLTLPAINVLILERALGRSASALSVLNFFWGLGAIVSKPFVDLTSSADGLFLTTILLSLPLFAGAGMVLLLPRAAETAAGPDKNDTAAEPPIWSTPVAWLIAAFNFIHVGFESGMGGWLTTYSERLSGNETIHWISPTLLYFLFFVAGRGIAPFLFRYLNENKMLGLGLTIILGGLAVVLTAGEGVQLSIGSSICGIGTSWIFPTNTSRFSKIFGTGAMRRSTPLFVCGTLGAAATTWLIGLFSDKTGDLRSGMFVLAVSVIVLLLIQTALVFALHRQIPKDSNL